MQRRLIDSHVAASGKPLSLKDIQVIDPGSKQPTAVFSAVVLLDANNLAQMLLKVHQVDAAMAQYFFAGFLAYEVLASSHVGKSTREALAAYRLISTGGKKGNQITNKRTPSRTQAISLKLIDK